MPITRLHIPILIWTFDANGSWNQTVMVTQRDELSVKLPARSALSHTVRSRAAVTGRLGNELEVMGLALFNGKLYGGTLPLAQVYRCDDAGWALTGLLDYSDVVFRRAWSMAVYGGRLFGGTLPSGRVHALEAGVATSHDSELAPGWRHVAAVRAGNHLRLFVDGKRAAASTPFDPAGFDLTANASLKIGFGEHDYFHGSLRDVLFYRRALSDREVSRLFRESK